MVGRMNGGWERKYSEKGLPDNRDPGDPTAHGKISRVRMCPLD